MAIRIIRTDDDEILRKKSRDVTQINERIIEILNDMADTMYAEDGVGLAAPQVGILKRLVVIDTGEGLIELINPQIVQKSEELIADIEGCLSLPGFMGEVERPGNVVVEALNRHGETVKICGDNLLARVLCHEIDHLEGILFSDIAIREVSKEELAEMRRKNKKSER